MMVGKGACPAMSIKTILGVISPVHIWVVTRLRGGTSVGKDGYGNRYYRSAAIPGYGHERRWVVYKGEAEPSAVPPEWHGWLHHQTDVIPGAQAESYRRPWQKPHRPNRTGTGQAWRPAGYGPEGKRAPASADYESWRPPAGGL